jgi:endonuclease YncB( thermonuclease family)
VYDGDTVELEIKRIVTVRLLDCWAPEIRTKNAAEKQKGFESKHHLARLLPKKSTVILHIPGEEKIKNVFTFGRVLGHIWPKEQEKNVSELQVEAGHATAKKEKK